MKKIVMILIPLLFLTACREIKEIQYQAYAVGLGIDYKDKEYAVTIQFLDFSNVAKSEEGKGEQPSKVWIGNGKGKSIEEAINKINQGIQLPINFDQIKVIVFGDSLLKYKLKSTLAALDASYNIRLTGEVYGTDQPLEKVFTAKIPFYYPYNESQISYPKLMEEEQGSTIPSINLQKLIYQFNEKATTTLLPALSVNNTIIKEDEGEYVVPTINGAYIIRNKEWKGFLNVNDLMGFILVNKDSFRTDLTLTIDDNQLDIEILKPSMKHKVMNKKPLPSIALDITIDVSVLSLIDTTKSKEIQQALKKDIVNQVYHSYVKSKEMGGDIFQFENFLYKYRYDIWYSLKDKKFPSLKKEDIHVKIDNLKSVPKLNSNFQS